MNMPPYVSRPGFLTALALASACLNSAAAASHQTNSIEGWTVLVNERLLARGFDNAEGQGGIRALVRQRTPEHEGEGLRDDRPDEILRGDDGGLFLAHDFVPFTRDELKQHDPAMDPLLGRLWGVTR